MKNQGNQSLNWTIETQKEERIFGREREEWEPVGTQDDVDEGQEATQDDAQIPYLDNLVEHLFWILCSHSNSGLQMSCNYLAVF